MNLGFPNQIYNFFYINWLAVLYPLQRHNLNTAKNLSWTFLLE